jgi:hypothetical protein
VRQRCEPGLSNEVEPLMMRAYSQFELQNARESRPLLDVTENSQGWGGTTVNAGVLLATILPAEDSLARSIVLAPFRTAH